jgi:hypothetical protein
MQDSNLRPSAPKADALPDCANHRNMYVLTVQRLRSTLRTNDIHMPEYFHRSFCCDSYRHFNHMEFDNPY